LAPCEPTQRVCNVMWAGARLSDIIAQCVLRPTAKFVCSTGADYGEFGGVRVEAYVKDMPIDRLNEDVLIAYEMNEQPLAPEHGFPARLVVPGFYGTNSVKWLTRVTLSEERASSPFTTRWYNDPVQDDDASTSGRTAPVWAIAPQSVIVAPAPDSIVEASKEIEIWGWAWADGGVARVDVRADAGDWQPTELEPVSGRAWQRFTRSWTLSKSGVATLASRAVARSGECQPEAGRRNAIYSVSVNVV
jgi:DMSO/TMAO reductase YedYZ molybdopterin-dependent catalytic subunit